jgi:hypothetical protein
MKSIIKEDLKNSDRGDNLEIQEDNNKEADGLKNKIKNILSLI